MELPTEATKTGSDPSRLKILLYGLPKIGKSTWASQVPDILMLACEPGLGHIKVHQLAIPGLPALREAYKLLAAGDHKFKAVGIDTVGVVATWCQEEVVREWNTNHTSERITFAGDITAGQGHRLVADKKLLGTLKGRDRPKGSNNCQHQLYFRLRIQYLHQ